MNPKHDVPAALGRFGLAVEQGDGCAVAAETLERTAAVYPLQGVPRRRPRLKRRTIAIPPLPISQRTPSSERSPTVAVRAAADHLKAALARFAAEFGPRIA